MRIPESDFGKRAHKMRFERLRTTGEHRCQGIAFWKRRKTDTPWARVLGVLECAVMGKGRMEAREGFI
jgi:hypothetical protein